MDNFLVYVLSLFILVGYIIVLFFSKADLYGYLTITGGLLLIECYFILYIMKEGATNNKSIFRFIYDIISKTSHIVGILIAFIFMVVINSVYYKYINNNMVTSEYKTFNNIFLLLTSGQLYLLYKQLKETNMVRSTNFKYLIYLVTLIQIIVVVIMQINLKYFLTDG